MIVQRVIKIDGKVRDKPIVHRVLKVHEKEDGSIKVRCIPKTIQYR